MEGMKGKRGRIRGLPPGGGWMRRGEAREMEMEMERRGDGGNGEEGVKNRLGRLGLELAARDARQL
jgi:hypothetical protein